MIIFIEIKAILHELEVIYQNM